MSRKIVFVSCVKSKQDKPCRAEDMYISPLFKKTMAYAESLRPSEIFILSAKYGLLTRGEIIAPYEKTLKTMSAPEKREWAKGVLAELHKSCDTQHDEFTFLAGIDYRKELEPHLKHSTAPMKGLRFGPQLKWLGSQIK